MNAQNEVGQDAISTNIAYQDALNDAREAVEQARAGVEGYGLTLDVTTEAGRRNQGILVDIADSGWKAAEAQLALDGNTEAFQQRLQNTRDDLVQRAIDFGATRDEAEALADQILKIPTKREIQILADTSAAQRALANFQSLLSRVGVTGVIQLGFNPTGPLPTYANGGFRTAADGDYAPRLSQQPAMMLSAGRAIVWREDETQGETFIPHALSKRGPAEMYLARTAALFGGVYIPAGARGFADGDFRAALEESDPRRPSAEFNLGGVHFHNPVVRDIVADSREAVSTIKAELGV